MRIIALCITFLFFGCSTNPWAYDSAPGQGAMGFESATRPIILLGEFDSSTNVDSRWSDVAPSMREAFSRALLKTGKFDVVTDAALSSEAETILSSYDASRTQSLESVLYSLNTDRAFYVTGKVTDFLHTSDAPESVQRLSWFETANDALVAIELTAVDLQTGRTTLSDQIVATVAAGDAAADQYGSLEFGSYLFWSTPLGKASSEAVDLGVAKLATIQAATPGVSKIATYEEGTRAVEIKNGKNLADGGIYYVGRMDSGAGVYVAVDDDFGRPLRLRVERKFWGSYTGWLLSKPAGYESIVGATLSKAPFATQLTFE